MGTFSVTLEIGTPSAGEFTQVEALVDTGATYTVLPAEALVRLGIQPIETVSFELADDRIVEYQVGEARVRLDGRERTTLVVFGPEGSAPLLAQQHSNCSTWWWIRRGCGWCLYPRC